MNANFKEILRSELDFQGLTVKELSAKTDIPKATLDCYLGARSSIPPADVAVKIASALGVSVEYLVTGSMKNQTEEMLRELMKYIKFHALFDDFHILPENIQYPITVMIQAAADRERAKQTRP
ncbi:MAG: helix-turn-helix transcriptional regulator [Treponemataceae bacterium]|nr:MAG: helix-turn-helix transcriptional regulator [Treponemataceae bacterium]